MTICDYILALVFAMCHATMMSVRWTFCDVDGTLILSSKPKGSKSSPVVIADPSGGMRQKVWAHKTHIKILRLIHSHGDVVVVWSSAGKAWADAVVDALGIRDIVSFTLQKPDTCIDNEQTKYWMTLHPRWYKP